MGSPSTQSHLCRLLGEQDGRLPYTCSQFVIIKSAFGFHCLFRSNDGCSHRGFSVESQPCIAGRESGEKHHSQHVSTSQPGLGRNAQNGRWHCCSCGRIKTSGFRAIRVRKVRRYMRADVAASGLSLFKFGEQLVPATCSQAMMRSVQYCTHVN